MGCLASLLPLLVWLVVVIAVITIARILVAYIPAPSIVVQILNVILWAVVSIAALYVVFDLLSCILPMPRLR